MANTQFLSTTELDQDAQKQAFIQFLKTNPYFKGVNYGGANINALLDVLNQNTSLNAFYLNMVGSETYLDSATLRDAAVSKAKELNYTPRSRASATAIVNVTIGTSNTQVSTVTIPKLFYFSARQAGATRLFSTNEAVVARNEGGTINVKNLELFEGRIITEKFVAGPTTEYILSSPNIDINSINVLVFNSTTDIAARVFNRAENLFGLTSTSPVFFVEGYKSNQYRLSFGNGITGVLLNDGNLVQVTYRDCSAADGDNCTGFRAVTFISDADGNVFSDIAVTTIQASAGGAEREDIDSIKFNAPRHFAAQDRAITKNDYLVLVKNQFPTIQSVSVFGGEELPFKRYGKVVIATKPFGEETTQDSIKNEIVTFLADKTGLTVTPIMADPDYFFVEVTSAVTYDRSITNKSEFDIETVARGAIDTYANQNLLNFNADFRFSHLCSTIDNADPAIVSNDTSVRMIKRIAPIPTFAYTTMLSFGNRLQTLSAPTLRDVNNPAVVESSFFNYLHTDNTIYLVKLQDDGLGVLRIVSSTSTILKTNTGTVDYKAGTVNITQLIIQEPLEGHISIYARLATKDMVIGQSQMINIEQIDVEITVETAS
jgi:hypothetical protein